MIKKLILGLALFLGCISQDAMGMESLVSDIAKDPTNRDKLKNLVVALVDKSEGASRTEAVISILSGIQIDERDRVDLDKIDCMIGIVSSDWYEGCRKIHSVDYYVDGALNGEFGPYDLYSGKVCK